MSQVKPKMSQVKFQNVPGKCLEGVATLCMCVSECVRGVYVYCRGACGLPGTCNSGCFERVPGPQTQSMLDKAAGRKKLSNENRCSEIGPGF